MDSHGFSFRIKSTDSGAVSRVLTASLLFLGLGACLWGGLGLSETGSNPLLLAVAGIVYCATACRLPKRALAFQAIAAAVLVLYSILVSRYIIDGWNVTMNAVFQVLERRLGYIFPRYEVTAAVLPPSLCAGLFLALPTVLLGLLCARTVCGHGIWMMPTGILLCALFALGVTNLYPPDWRWILLLLGLTACSLQRLCKRNVWPAGLCQSGSHILLFSLLLAVCVAPGLLWNQSGTNRALENRRTVERAVHRFRYENGATTLPEGDFAALQAFVPGTTTALTITMEEPQELYLRGYVGETYTGSGWADLEPSQKSDYATLFSWLHERGFYGQAQYAQLCRALGLSGEEGMLSLTVEDACTGWQYAPYELMQWNMDPRQIGDTALPAAGLHGERDFTYSMSGVSVEDYDGLAARLTAARKAGSTRAVDYLTSENAYREFVYENYLEMPEDTRQILAQVFTRLELPKNGRVSFHDAQMVVRVYLSSIVTYNEEPMSITDGTDFIEGFLLDTKEGYSVHYATAAALMFRYLGVPARYVEGWHLPADAAAEMEADKPTALDQSYAHAWVEIYRDGVGFVPFEITPPYTAPVEQSNMTQGGSGGAELPPEETPEDAPPPWQLALAALLTLLLLLLAATVLRRARKRETIRRLLEAECPSDAVSNMTAWAVQLLEHLGIYYDNGSLSTLLPQVETVLGHELAVQFAAVLDIQQQALFSRNGVTDAAREGPRVLLAQLEAALRQKATWTERLRLRWIWCVI